MSHVRTIEHSNHRIEISIDRSRSIDRFRSIDRSIDRFRNRSRPDRPRVDATRHKKNRSTIAMMLTTTATMVRANVRATNARRATNGRRASAMTVKVRRDERARRRTFAVDGLFMSEQNKPRAS